MAQTHTVVQAADLLSSDHLVGYSVASCAFKRPAHTYVLVDANGEVVAKMSSFGAHHDAVVTV